MANKRTPFEGQRPQMDHDRREKRDFEGSIPINGKRCQAHKSACQERTVPSVNWDPSQHAEIYVLFQVSCLSNKRQN